MTRSRHIPHVLAAVIAVIVVYAGLSGPHILHGDGREYILQTQALVFDHALRIDTEARREYWNHTNPHGITLQEADPPAATPSTALTESSQAGGGFGGLYPDRFGHYPYYHFWAYSAVVAPVYPIFRERSQRL